MKFRSTLGSGALLLAVALGACGGSTASDATGGPPPEPPDIVDILVDANRDGFVDESDNEGEELWTKTSGAAFLPNLDDDNFDGIRDGDDNVVNVVDENNQADAADLATLLVRPWPEVPKGSIGWLTMDAMSLPHVRIFKRTAEGGWELVMGRSSCDGKDAGCTSHAYQLSEDDIRNGAAFGVEGTTLAGLHDAVSTNPETGQPELWSGLLDLKFEVFEEGASEPVITDDNPDGADYVQMRVASWILFGNLSTGTDTIFSNVVSPPFVEGIEVGTNDAGVSYNKITSWQDHWTEDWMQTGFVSVPWGAAENGDAQVHGMRLAMPRPWGRGNSEKDLPVNWLNKAAPAGHTGFDTGYFVTYKKPNTGDSYDSHGNHDLVPAYSHNGQDFPYGRIIHGSGVLPETTAFYEAQKVQSPVLKVKTSWLIVGHVDEVFSYVPADTPRGWKLLVASPSMARQMLEKAQTDGHGEERMFIGKKWSNGKDAEVSINEVLGDSDLMSWSQTAQTEIDGMVEQMKQEIGLTDDEIVPIPSLFERDFGAYVAYNPGTVNSLVFGNHMVIPDPFGPKVSGVDIFRKDLEDRLGTDVNGLGKEGTGMSVFFTDDWDWYHRLLGEVHCGTNQEGPPQANVKWWEAAE